MQKVTVSTNVNDKKFWQHIARPEIALGVDVPESEYNNYEIVVEYEPNGRCRFDSTNMSFPECEAVASDLRHEFPQHFPAGDYMELCWIPMSK